MERDATHNDMQTKRTGRARRWGEGSWTEGDVGGEARGGGRGILSRITCKEKRGNNKFVEERKLKRKKERERRKAQGYIYLKLEEAEE